MTIDARQGDQGNDSVGHIAAEIRLVAVPVAVLTPPNVRFARTARGAGRSSLAALLPDRAMRRGWWVPAGAAVHALVGERPELVGSYRGTARQQPAEYHKCSLNSGQADFHHYDLKAE
ncbi:MAG: hypothetical protein EOO77_09530 [Oxalobacteraceae bacterium]|nr:MAG: hypothetical protein EOO77_09530 [Oxalobacteraceae bacterium]